MSAYTFFFLFLRGCYYVLLLPHCLQLFFCQEGSEMPPSGFMGNRLIETPRRRGRKKEREQAHFGYCKQLHQHLVFQDPLRSHPAPEDLMWSLQAPSAVRRLLRQLEAQAQQCRYTPLPADRVLGCSARQGPESWACICGPRSCQQVSPWGLCLAVHLPRVKSLFTPCSLVPQRKSRKKGVREILYVQHNQYGFNGRCGKGPWCPVGTGLAEVRGLLPAPESLLPPPLEGRQRYWRVQRCKEEVSSFAGAFGAGRNPGKYLDVAVSSFSKCIQKGCDLSWGALAAGRGRMFLCTNMQREGVLS